MFAIERLQCELNAPRQVARVWIHRCNVPVRINAHEPLLLDSAPKQTFEMLLVQTPNEFYEQLCTLTFERRKFHKDFVAAEGIAARLKLNPETWRQHLVMPHLEKGVQLWHCVDDSQVASVKYPGFSFSIKVLFLPIAKRSE